MAVLILPKKIAPWPRPGGRSLITIVALALASCAPAGSETAPAPAAPPAAAGGAEILWDEFGIPHIYAQDNAGLFGAFGWAQMRNHGDLLLRLLGQSRGRGAEYWGPELLDDDRWLLNMRVPERAREADAACSGEICGYLDAFVAGINAYAAAHPDSLADEVEAVLPVTRADIMANAMATGLLFSSARQGAARWSEPRGSNAWAIGPSKSASGNAMLLANPHLPWGGAFTWFEAHLSGPGVDAYGAALVGMPVLNIAFNQSLGWTHTVNTQDAEDLYELTIEGDGYRWDGGVRAFETDTVSIRVRQADGSLAEETLVRRRSVHGPVLATRGGAALALQAAYSPAAEGFLFLQWWEMMRADNRVAFERALARNKIVGQNITYADRDGNILYAYGAMTPRRPRGDYTFWQGLIRGDTSALLWQGEHTYAEMPRVLNPPSGWVQNANDGPWYSTYPVALDPQSFPSYFAPGGLDFRPQQSIQLLLESGKLSLDDMIRLKHSTEMELAVRLVPDLVAAARARESALARQAADVLGQWDLSADAGSRGGVLFQAWLQAWSRSNPGDNPGDRLFATPWSAADPLATPDGLADPAAAVAALEAAARTLQQSGAALDVAWGDVHRLRRDGVNLPANGAPGWLGTFRVTVFRDLEDGTRVPVHGDSYVAATEFSAPVRARALLSYGNASQPGSPHRTDQLGLYSQKQLREVWLTRAAVMAHLRDREVVRSP